MSALDQLRAERDKLKAERDQAISGCRLVLDAGTDIFKLIDAIHAIRTLLTKL